MKFLVYSSMNADTVVSNFGEPEYSYYFVLREFVPFLQTLGEVIHINDPRSEVDAIYQQAQQAGEDCLFLSFSAPHNTCLNLQCPTIPVFAWEFSTIPNEAWWPERPQDNWQWCLEQCAGAIVHSRQTADLVRELMGNDFSVVDIPAPLWDRIRATATSNNSTPEGKRTITLERGLLLDTHNPDYKLFLPNMEEIVRDVAEYKKQIPIDLSKGFRREQPTSKQATKIFLAAWYQEVWATHVPARFRERLDKWAFYTNPWRPTRHQLQLSGVVFTSLFNPLDGRKNWQDMLTTFCHTFKDEPQATLIFKLGHRDYERALRPLMLQLAKQPEFKCRVIFIHGFLSNDSYQSLLEQTDFALNASHGEGQCLPLMEYLTYGKPAIAPTHSALADYIDEDIAFIVNSSDDATNWPHDPRIAYRALRKQLDWTSLSTAYRDAFNCRQQEPNRYQEMSNNAILRMQQHCSFQMASTKLALFITTLKQVKSA